MKLPTTFNEEMVRAELYRRSFAKIGVALEVKFYIATMNKRMLADVVFFDIASREIVALVEVKRSPRKWRQGKPTRQQAKYDATGLPWRYCDGAAKIDETIEWALTLARGANNAEA